MHNNQYIPTEQRFLGRILTIQGLDTSLTSLLKGNNVELGDAKSENYSESRIIDLFPDLDTNTTEYERNYFDNMRARTEHSESDTNQSLAETPPPPQGQSDSNPLDAD